MSKGFIKLYRQILDNPVINKDSDHVAVWIYLLLNATHQDYDIDHLGKRFTLKRGQLVTGRKVIAEKYKISETKVQRVLKRFESEQQIEQQTTNKNRVITIVNYDLYQSSEQQTEQQVNNKRTTSEQQVNTNNKHKEHNQQKEQKKKEGNVKNNVTDNVTPFKEIIDYLNEKTGKSFRHQGKKNKDLIQARFNEGYTLEDFKRVIDIKVDDWLKDKKMQEYLRPETLFSNKFEGYLNSKPNKPKKKYSEHRTVEDFEDDDTEIKLPF